MNLFSPWLELSGWAGVMPVKDLSVADHPSFLFLLTSGSFGEATTGLSSGTYAEVHILEQLRKCIYDAETLLPKIYTYRSIAMCLPIAATEPGVTQIKTDGIQGLVGKHLVGEILEPTVHLYEMSQKALSMCTQWLSEVLSDEFDCSTASNPSYNTKTNTHVFWLASGRCIKSVLLGTVLTALYATVANLLRMNALFNSKRSLQHDWSQYKVTCSKRDEVERIQPLLVPDFFKDRLTEIFRTLGGNVSSSPISMETNASPHETLARALLDDIGQRVDEKRFLLADERAMYALSACFLLTNVMTGALPKRHSVLSLLRENSHVPVYAEMYIILQSNSCDQDESEINLSEEVRRRFVTEEDLVLARERFTSVMAELTYVLQRVPKTAEGDHNPSNTFVTHELTRDLCSHAMTAVRNSLMFMAMVQQKLWLHTCCKYHSARGASAGKMPETPIVPSAQASSDPVQSLDISHWGRYMIHNHTQEELQYVVELVWLLKGVQSVLQRHIAVFQTFIRQHIFVTMQEWVHSETRVILSKLVREGGKSTLGFELLSQLRLVLGDWSLSPDGYDVWKTDPCYQGVKQESIRGHASGEKTAFSGSYFYANTERLNQPCGVQLVYFENALRHLLYLRSDGKNLDLAAEQIGQIQQELYGIMHWKYMLHLGTATVLCGDVGFLWSREWLMDSFRVYVFPISEAFLYGMIKNGLEKQHIPAHVLMSATLSIYNDAAVSSLSRWRSRAIFEEIQSEVRIVIESAVALLAQQILETARSLSYISVLPNAFLVQYYAARNQEKAARKGNRSIEHDASPRSVALTLENSEENIRESGSPMVHGKGITGVASACVHLTTVLDSLLQVFRPATYSILGLHIDLEPIVSDHIRHHILMHDIRELRTAAANMTPEKACVELGLYHRAMQHLTGMLHGTGSVDVSDGHTHSNGGNTLSDLRNTQNHQQLLDNWHDIWAVCSGVMSDELLHQMWQRLEHCTKKTYVWAADTDVFLLCSEGEQEFTSESSPSHLTASGSTRTNYQSGDTRTPTLKQDYNNQSPRRSADEALPSEGITCTTIRHAVHAYCRAHEGHFGREHVDFLLDSFGPHQRTRTLVWMLRYLKSSLESVVDEFIASWSVESSRQAFVSIHRSLGNMLCLAILLGREAIALSANVLRTKLSALFDCSTNRVPQALHAEVYVAKILATRTDVSSWIPAGDAVPWCMGVVLRLCGGYDLFKYHTCSLSSNSVLHTTDHMTSSKKEEDAAAVITPLGRFDAILELAYQCVWYSHQTTSALKKSYELGVVHDPVDMLPLPQGPLRDIF